MHAETPFWFVIPLRARASTRRWDEVCALLRACLTSVLNQSDGRFRVIISCTDAPDLGDIDDPRIETIVRDHPLPRDFPAMAADKRNKKRIAGAAIGRHGGGYIMLLDADDLVSAHLVEHILGDDNRAGYYVEDGYVLYTATKVLKPLHHFYRRCGSSYAVYYRPEDLPADEGDDTSLFDAFRNHRLARETAAERGITLAKLPFPAAVYVLETGQNLSLKHPKTGRWTARVRQTIAHLRRRFAPRDAVPAAVQREFALSLPA